MLINKYLKPAQVSTPVGRIWLAGKMNPLVPVSLNSIVKVYLALVTSLI